MTSSKQILDDLYQLKKSLPQNPIAKLDEVNTILLIFATKEEIAKTTDEKMKKDCQGLLAELELHYQELGRKNISNYRYNPLEETIKRN